MAIVTYRCDTCKREIQLQRNVHGLETPNRCIITHGCRGRLYFKKLLPDFIRGSSPAAVVGVDNWQQRNVLYDHYQAIARTEWTISHNLGNSVNVSAYVNIPTETDSSNLVELAPDDIIIISPDKITLRFSRPYSGMAQLVARASDPQLLQPSLTVTESGTGTQQLSNLGVLTVATKIPQTGVEPIVNFRITYNTPQETNQLATYVADDNPSLISPWNDFKRVVINGGLYAVRDFSAIIEDMSSGIIGNGSTFRFTSIDDNDNGTFRSIVPNEVFLLLSSFPYTNADKITEQVIDVVDVNETVNPFAFVYDTGEFFSSITVEQTIYPPVRSA